MLSIKKLLFSTLFFHTSRLCGISIVGVPLELVISVTTFIICWTIWNGACAKLPIVKWSGWQPHQSGEWNENFIYCLFFLILRTFLGYVERTRLPWPWFWVFWQLLRFLMRQAAEDFIKCLFLDFPKPLKISSHSDNFYFHFFKGKFLIISKDPLEIFSCLSHEEPKNCQDPKPGSRWTRQIEVSIPKTEFSRQTKARY